ncbi:MAG: hypothetical protein JW959_10900 [Pirellulales bacterium]|nr:hypothetical protein [Pirellulales bacterium]
MYRYSALIVLIVLTAAGCRSTAPTSDPFFGRTTIPPPATGSATGACADPYYQNPLTATTPPPGATQPTTTTIQPQTLGNGTSPYSAPRPLSTSPSTTKPASTAPATTAPPYKTNGAAPPTGNNPTTPNAPGWMPPGTSTNLSRPGITVSLPASSNATVGRSGSLDARTPRPVNSGDGNQSARAPITRTLTPRTTAADDDRVINLMDLPPAD